MAEGKPGCYLSVELDIGRAQADKAGEQGLVQVAVLLEGHVLHHWGQLLVVPNQDDPLQSRHSVICVLQED